MTQPNQQTLDLYLHTLAAHGNNIRRATKTLKNQNHNITEQQLTNWRNQNQNHYNQIRKNTQHQHTQTLAQQAEDLAKEAYEVQALAIEQTRQQLNAGNHKDPSTAAKNLATTAHLATQQAALLKGQPTQITQNQTVEQILAKLTNKLPDIQQNPPTQLPKPQPTNTNKDTTP